MNGVEFGKFVRSLRLKKKICSRELSNKIGKSFAYVSQLERGRIKNPNYNTAFRIFENLGYEKNKINDYLKLYGITSPEKELMKLENEVQQHQQELIFNRFDSHKFNEKIDLMGWIDTEVLELKERNENVYYTLDKFIDRDFSKSEKVISNIEMLLSKNKEHFNFFCDMFKYDYYQLSPDDRKQILSFMDSIMGKYNENTEATS